MTGRGRRMAIPGRDAQRNDAPSPVQARVPGRHAREVDDGRASVAHPVPGRVEPRISRPSASMRSSMSRHST